jgi:hypothetical protein
VHIPVLSDHPFRCYPTTRSGVIRPPVPVLSDHPFRRYPTTLWLLVAGANLRWLFSTNCRILLSVL